MTWSPLLGSAADEARRLRKRLVGLVALAALAWHGRSIDIVGALLDALLDVERQHGRLWAEPNEGSGATSWLSIRRAPDGIENEGLKGREA